MSAVVARDVVGVDLGGGDGAPCSSATWAAIVSQRALVRLASRTSPNTSGFVAHLWATTPPTPPAPMMRTLDMATSGARGTVGARGGRKLEVAARDIARERAFRVAYDGTDFHGWAAPGAPGRAESCPAPSRASSSGCSRRCTEQAMPVRGRVTNRRRRSRIRSAGRVRASDAHPDAGTGARPCSQLAADVVVLAAWEGAEGVDVRKDNQGKHYRYRLRCTEVADPPAVRYEWQLGRGLDLAPMQDAAARFVGTHDFAWFRASSCQAKTTVRTVTAVEITFGPAAVGPMSDRDASIPG